MDMNQNEFLEMLADPDEFQRLIQDGMMDLQPFVEAFPECNDLLAHKVISDPAEFQRLTQEICDLPHFVEAFPNYYNQIANRVFAEFQRFTPDGYSLYFVVKAFPHYNDRLADMVLGDAAVFERLVLNDTCEISHRHVSSLFPFLVDAFPNYNDRLADMVLGDAAVFSQLNLKGINGLIYLSRMFALHHDKLAVRVLDDPDQFKRFTDHPCYDLDELLAAFPLHHDKLAVRVLDHFDKFKQFTSLCASDLARLAEVFPQHSEIFGKPTGAEAEVAFHALEQQKASRQEIIKNVRILFELCNEHLPGDLIIMLAALTADAKYHDHSQSIIIAAKEFALIENEDPRSKSLPEPPAATISHSLHSNNKQEKSPQQQHEFDKLYGLIEFKKPSF